MKLPVLEMGPWMFRGICLAIAALGMIVLVWINGERMRLPSRREFRPLLVAALFNITAWHIVTAYGLAFMAAGRAGIIAYLMPVLTTVIAAPILGERITARKLLALALGLAGLGVLVAPEIGTIGGDLRGPALMFVSALCWAIGTMLVKGRRWSYSTVQLTTWQIILGGLPITILALFIAPLPRFAETTAWSWFGLFYASTVAMVWCHYTWYRLLHRLPASIASISTLAIPAVGVISSALFIGEPLGITEISALLLVLAAIAIVLRRT
jgi:drug/metabolite transporter (DMT)-like permease